jgi:hypothetical protein
VCAEETLFLCEENLLETQGASSRFVVVALERLADFSHIVRGASRRRARAHR